MTMDKKKSTRVISIRLPIGLYEKIEKLATQKRMPVHSYIINTIWTVTQWDGKNDSNELL